jgi:Fur family ferric uptake transcriptional regulator
VKKAFDTFRGYIARNNMKLTRQREIILRAFLESESHMSAEELYRRVSHEDSSIGLATVYRTLNLLVECGLAQRQQFGEGERRYESVLEHEHHDHLVCTRCGAIAEFYSPDVERLLDELGRERRFRIFNHRLELYGLCSACQG